MPRTDLASLPDDARIWVFGISPRLSDSDAKTVLQRIDPFLDQWAAHGTPITSARDIVEGSFLVIGVDKRSETSGCSIDRMFGVMRQLENDLGVSILDSTRIFYRGSDALVHAISRKDFRERGDLHTRVFDTTTERLGEVRAGGWERRAEESWHKQLL